jgi:hypothetical protein
MSSALDPTTDMAPTLAIAGTSGSVKAAMGGISSTGVLTGETRSGPHGTPQDLENAPPCAAFVPTTVWLD